MVEQNASSENPLNIHSEEKQMESIDNSLVGSPINRNANTLETSPELIIQSESPELNTSNPGELNTSESPIAPESQSHTVQVGETINTIGTQYGLNGYDLYNHNINVIEETARKFGQPSSRGGSFLPAGVVLDIPDMPKE